MFWGITLENGKRYTQTVNNSFHVSMAALECSSLDGNKQLKKVAVMIEHEKAEYLLCTLNSNAQLQQNLDLNFIEGQEVTFFTNGAGTVHLTGYVLVGDEMDEMESEDESEEEDEDLPTKASMKRKANESKEVTGAKNKKKKLDLFADKGNFKDLSDDDDDDESDFEIASDDDDSDEFPSPSKGKMNAKSMQGNHVDGKTPNKNAKNAMSAKKNESLAKTPASPKGKGKVTSTPFGNDKSAKKFQKDTPKKDDSIVQNDNAASTESAKKKKKKKKKKKNQNQNASMDSTFDKTLDTTVPSTPKEQKTPAKTPGKKQPVTGSTQKKPGGTVIEDLTIGSGPVAKQGRFVHILYEGKLTNNTVFDASKNQPLKFSLGKGEVIRGMDLGIEGMKVGGKRKITIPPTQGYGNKKMGTIPPNSTLMFEVELKAVS